MFKNISDFFLRIADWKTFGAALCVYMVFGGYIMPHGLATLQQMNGKKTEVLDLQFSYTPEKAHAILSEYTDQSRDYAARFELIADGLYPISYTFLFLIMMAWLFRSLSAYGVNARYLHMLPFVVMTADYSENTGIITMLSSYPNFSDTVVRISSVFTSIKWTLLAVEGIIILTGLGMIIYYRVSGRKTA